MVANTKPIASPARISPSEALPVSPCTMLTMVLRLYAKYVRKSCCTNKASRMTPPNRQCGRQASADRRKVATMPTGEEFSVLIS